MHTLSAFLQQPQHAALVEEYFALDTAEDKLTWLMERTPHHRVIPIGERCATRRVPGCLSGLWLQVELSAEDRCLYSCASESDVVQGIASLLCDLYSNRVAHEIVTIGSTFASALKLDGLLTLTRRRAVASVIDFILQYASTRSPTDTPSDTSTPGGYLKGR